MIALVGAFGGAIFGMAIGGACGFPDWAQVFVAIGAATFGLLLGELVSCADRIARK